MRPHVLAIYAFSRVADDFADEPAYAGKRHFALDQWEHELFRTFHGEADHPIFVALRSTVESYDLPITPFAALLTGFRMDLLAAPYATFDELRTYCRYSSEPMGQIILRLFGYRDPALQSYANDFCTALQLATFLQDLGSDLDRGRIYVPGEDLRHFGITSEHLETLRHGGRHLARLPRGWRDLLRFQSARARALMERGRPLLDQVGADLGLELELTYHSGQAMLDKIDSQGEELLRSRPTLGRADRAKVLAKAVGKRWPQWPSWLARRGELGDL
jgi:squalene synthase HpnC